ncbi:TIGR00730 family Rossman fold protein [Candidatus Uhrbacteria bacterium]|nr:TIGR00730 family Rossman fold protein [Candidatus Uhrbacteria bacterium]
MDNKCFPMEEENFTENMNWRIFRIMAEFIEGFEFLSHLRKEVSVFGSARSSPDNHYYQMAKELGRKCAKAGFSMVTGGGPGIMEAANWGAFEAGGESVGLDIALPHEQRRNQYIKRAMGFHYFFTRKVMLSASAQAYIFFPGGFGTLDEFFEIVTLIQTGKMSDQVPVIVVGKKYWAPFVQWMKEALFQENGFISPEDLNIIHVVDSADEALKIIKKTHERTL